MTNRIKPVGGSLALQVTVPARDAGLVEDAHDDPDRHHLADVKVASVDDTLLVFDSERTAPVARADLYLVAVRDAASQHAIRDGSIQPKGHGYLVTLPGARDAGFREGDAAPVRSAPGLLLITADEHRHVRRGEDLEASWREMVD